MVTTFYSLLRQCRNQANLTQEELAQLAGLNGPRMLQSWEGGFSFPTAKRLRRLLEIFYERQAFPAGQELHRAVQLWEAVKTSFEAGDLHLRGYPRFDSAWFMEKVVGDQQSQGQTSLPLAAALEKGITFVGREEELARLKKMLGEERLRLVSLCGPGGVGKTRLALELKGSMISFCRDGVHFVQLEVLDYPSYLAATIAQGLGLVLPENASPLGVLQKYLSNKEILLILDNFEQLIKGASQLDILLEAAPGLQILVTSREPLQLSDEKVFVLKPLPSPRSKLHDDLVNNPAILLFYARARQADPGFKFQDKSLVKVASICEKLDNLPLAIELAASRVVVLSVEQILEHLDSSLKLLHSPRHPTFPDRHKSLYRTLEWSYRLLEPSDRQLMARLALFRQEWTAEAAEAAAGFDGLVILDGLESLVARNLLMRRSEPEKPIHFRMLQVIREFALQKLAEQSEKEQAELSFIEYYLRLVEEIEPKARSENQKQFLNFIEDEYPNIREALQRAIQRQDGERAGRLCGAIWVFWWARGFIPEGRTFLEQALRLLPPFEASPGKASALNAAGNLADIQGDLAAAESYFEQSALVFADLRDKRGQSNALNNLGNVLSIRGEYALSQQYLASALELRLEIGHPQLIAASLNNLGRLARLIGDEDAGLGYYEQALYYLRQHGESLTLAQLLGNLSNLSLEMGKPGAAELYAEECLEMSKGLDFKLITILALQALAEIAVDRKNWPEAAELYQQGLELATEVGDRMYQAIMLNGLGRSRLEINDFKTARRLIVQSRQLFEALESKEGRLLVILNQAILFVREGETRRALHMAETVQTLAQEWQTPLKRRARLELINLLQTMQPG